MTKLKMLIAAAVPPERCLAHRARGLTAIRSTGQSQKLLIRRLKPGISIRCWPTRRQWRNTRGV